MVGCFAVVIVVWFCWLFVSGGFTCDLVWWLCGGLCLGFLWFGIMRASCFVAMVYIGGNTVVGYGVVVVIAFEPSPGWIGL